MDEDYAPLASQYSEALHQKYLRDKLFILKYNIPLEYSENLPPYKFQEIVDFYDKLEKERKEKHQNE